jgi:hypothetical protein
MCFWWVILMAVCSGNHAWAAGPSRTLVSDTVYKADGGAAQGTLLISWGESGLSKTASNYFGIKAHGNHEKIAMRTNECVGGEAHMCDQEFAKYAGMEECFRDRDELIGRMKV